MSWFGSTSKRKSLKINNPKKTQRRPQWDDSLTDRSLYKATESEIQRRHEVHKSINAEKIKTDVLKLQRSKSRLSLDENAFNRNGDYLNNNSLSLSQYDLTDQPKLISRTPSITPAPGCHPSDFQKKPPRKCWDEPTSLTNALNSSTNIQQLLTSEEDYSQEAQCRRDGFKFPQNGVIQKSTSNGNESPLLMRGTTKVSGTNQRPTSTTITTQTSSTTTQITNEELLAQFQSLKQDVERYRQSFIQEEYHRKELESEVMKLRVLVCELTKDVIYLRSNVSSCENHAIPLSPPLQQNRPSN